MNVSQRTCPSLLWATKITVLKAGAEWEVLAVNEIDDEVNATPALSDGRVYVRTHTRTLNRTFSH